MKSSIITKIIISALALAMLAGCGTPAQDSASSSTADTSTTESAASTASVSDTSTAESQTESSEETKAEIIKEGKCGDHVTYTLDSNGVMTIEGKGKMYEYGDTVDFSYSLFSGTSSKLKDVKEVTVKIKDGVTSISSSAFYYCTKLTSVEIPDSVTTIDAGAFNSCRNLKKIVLPDSITSIGKEAFVGCGNLTDIHIPNNLKNIDALLDIPFENITVDTENKNYTLKDDVLFSKDMTELITVLSKKSGAYTIPNTVSTIHENAFSKCKLTDVTVPSSINRINACAFASSRVENVKISDGVTGIDETAFGYCDHLKSIHIPASVTEIAHDGFEKHAFFTGRVGIEFGEATIYGESGSYAETFANEYHMTFKAE